MRALPDKTRKKIQKEQILVKTDNMTRGEERNNLLITTELIEFDKRKVNIKRLSYRFQKKGLQ